MDSTPVLICVYCQVLMEAELLHNLCKDLYNGLSLSRGFSLCGYRHKSNVTFCLVSSLSSNLSPFCCASFRSRFILNCTLDAQIPHVSILHFYYSHLLFFGIFLNDYVQMSGIVYGGCPTCMRLKDSYECDPTQNRTFT